MTKAVTVQSNNFRFELNCAETNQQYPGDDKRPIGLFVKTSNREFLYQVILSSYPVYQKIKDYLYQESEKGRKDQLHRAIVHIEALRAIYPELVI